MLKIIKEIKGRFIVNKLGHYESGKDLEKNQIKFIKIK